jgi:hypothetical protein
MGSPEELGQVGAASLTGAVTKGWDVPAGSGPAGVVADDRYMYWAQYGASSIARSTRDGSSTEFDFIKTEGVPTGVAVDAGHIYWTEDDYDAAWIGRASLDGSAREEHFLRVGAQPAGLAADSTYLYWTHRLSNPDETAWRSAIGRARLDGTYAVDSFISVSNKVTGVAVNSRFVYWSNSGEDAIGRANIDGTDIVQRCITDSRASLGNAPEGLAATEGHIYWTNFPDNTITRANLGGSEVEHAFLKVKGVPEGVTVAAPAGDDAADPSQATSCQGSRPPIVLGSPDAQAGLYAVGWGEAAPPVISNGGHAASGTISDIVWTSWGGQEATGRGTNPIYRPEGGYYDRPVAIELRATSISTCSSGGRRVYTHLLAREPDKPGGPMGPWRDWSGSSLCEVPN